MKQMIISVCYVLLGFSLLTSAHAGANMEGCDLTGASLKKCDLDGVNFNNAVLKGTNMGATVWPSVICPDGTLSNECGYSCEGHLSTHK